MVDISMFHIARYYVLDDPLPEAREGGFDYIVAGNGVFKRARNRHLDVCIPVIAYNFPGLRPCSTYIKLRRMSRLPARLIEIALADARRAAWPGQMETMYHVYLADDRVRLYKPPQRADARSLAYRGGGEAGIVMDLHSHCQMPAFFSSTDDRDEAGFRLYAVIGRIFDPRPEITVRVGVWGNVCPVPVAEVFSLVDEYGWRDVGWTR